jgi:mannose-6-phosphate isomerase-like protein (cupin superfamily)
LFLHDYNPFCFAVHAQGLFMDIRRLSLPAGIGLTHLRVYTEPGPDGVVGGSPHMHAVCSEMYFILGGSGAVELIGADGYSLLPLETNQVVFFRPGVIHRLHNPKKNLEILVIMQNGGLPERGDFVLTMEPGIMRDERAYAEAIRVNDVADAIRRRDDAVRGFLPLRDAMRGNTPESREMLRQFYRDARGTLASKIDGFEWVLKSGPQTELKASLDAIDFLRFGRTDYLEQASHWTKIKGMDEPERLGMCGFLHQFPLDENFFAEGRKVA